METNPFSYLTIFPKRISTSYVECFKVYQFNALSPIQLNPEGKFELIFQIDGLFSQVPHSIDHWSVRPKFFIGGLHMKSYSVRAHQEQSTLISVNFSPKGARCFIPAELHHFKNKLIPIQDVFRGQQLSWIHELQDAKGIEQQLDLIEQFLIQVFREKLNSPVDQALDIIFQKKGLAKIQELAEEVFLSPAQFRKRFNAEIGMSPKEYCKVIRINHVLKELDQHDGYSLTELAYQWNYFDQAHFIKDFKNFTGSTPKQYIRQDK